jgi:hypothetical protein
MLVLFIIIGGIALAMMLMSAADRDRTRRAIQESQQRARHTVQQSQQRAVAVVRQRRLQADAAKRQAARNMQVAIQQLSQSPDFRRAASFAAAAAQAGVPVAFRQRQFRRLRSLLVEHLARRFQADAALESAAAGLRELVGNLGMAGYEADYIATEAQSRQRTTAQPAPNYRDRLRNLHAEHTQRMEAIRSTADLDEGLLEQLEEAEQERFRRELLGEPEQER